MAVPFLVAHRGQMATYPENTLAGLEAALQCGAVYVEFDVQSTADGVFVMFHDEELKRVTGVEGKLFETTYQALKELCICESERFPNASFSEPVSTLAEVVRLLQRYPKATAFVEIKEETIDEFGVEKVIDQLLEEIAVIRRQCVVISFHQEALKYVQSKGGFRVGWVLHKYDEQHHKQAQGLNPDYLIVNHTKLAEDQAPWRGDWDWMLYDITDPELALKYADDVTFIETGDVCAMLKHPVLALNAVKHDSGV